MAFGYKTFYSGRYSNGPDHTISNLLNTKQVKVCYSDPTVSNLWSWIHLFFSGPLKFSNKHTQRWKVIRKWRHTIFERPNFFLWNLVDKLLFYYLDKRSF